MVLLFYLFFVIVQLNDDEYNYKDPLDYYSSSSINENRNIEECVESEKYILEHTIIKRLIKSIVMYGSESISKKININMSVERKYIVDLENYLNDTNNRSGLLRIMEMLNNMVIGDIEEKSYKNIFFTVKNNVIHTFKVFYYTKKTDLAINFSYLIIMLMIIFSATNIFFNTNSFTFLVILLLSQAVLVEWVNLYQKSLANKMSKYNKRKPLSCENIDDLSYYNSISLWFSNAFILKSDECHEYYSHILVDPITEVSILEACSSAFRRFLGNYFVDLAVVINNSIINLLTGLPIQWQIIVFTTLLFTIISVSLILRGFELNTPLLGVCFGKSQKQPTINIDNYSEIRAIQAIREAVRDELSKSLNDSKDYFVSEIVQSINKSRDFIEPFELQSSFLT